MKEKSIKFKSLGTNIEIKIFDDNPSPFLSEARKIVEGYNDMIVAFYRNFERVKNDFTKKKGQEGFKIRVSEDILYMVERAYKLDDLKDSRLNLLLGPVIDLWDFNGRRNFIPDVTPIKKALDLTSKEDFTISHEDRTFYFAKNSMKLDLGCLAKGYICDKLVEYFKENAIVSALINLGGNIYCHGFNLYSKDLYWRIGIQAPFKERGENILLIKANDLSFVTSGIYERGFSHSGKYFHHILDPETGYPIGGPMQSLTIISESSLDGEIFSSSLFGMDFERIKKEAWLRGFTAIAVYESGLIKTSRDLSKYMEDKL